MIDAPSASPPASPSPRRRPRRPGVCVGIDLAGVEHRETGVAILRGGRLELLTSAGDDAEILALARVGRALGDGRDQCAADPPDGPMLPRRRLPVPDRPGHAEPTARARAGADGHPDAGDGADQGPGPPRRADRRRAGASSGYQPLEVYPFATLRLLGLPCQGKKTPAGRRRIHRALKPLVPGLNHPRASEHQLDSVVCASRRCSGGRAGPGPSAGPTRD